MENIKFPRPEINFFETKSHPYYILTQEYMQGSCGLRNFYHLCHALNQLGYEAYVTDDNPELDLRVPLLTPRIRERHRRQGLHPIAVYGEEIDDNLLEGDVVAWWIMNMPGHVRNKRSFGEDLTFYYLSSYACGEAVTRLLSFEIADTRVFNNVGGADAARTGFCWYAHKYLRHGRGKIRDYVVNNGISVCRDVILSKEELAGIFRKTKMLVCYEESMIALEARCCGCDVVFVNTPYFSETAVSDMIAEGNDVATEYEIENGYTPKSGRESFICRLRLKEENAWKSLGGFIEITQRRASGGAIGPGGKLPGFCRGHKAIYIYGAGHWGKQCSDALKSLGIRVEAFVVSDGRKPDNPPVFQGLPVISASDIPRSPEGAGIVVAVSKQSREAICGLLSKKGLDTYTYPVLV